MPAQHPLPTHLRVLAGRYFIASLAHFTHNAEFIAFYPNMRKRLHAGACRTLHGWRSPASALAGCSSFGAAFAPWAWC